LLASFALTRAYSVVVYHLLSSNQKLLQRIIEDQFHHYQLGVIALIADPFLKKKRHLLAAIGLGIVLEEWPIVLNDPNLPIKNTYHAKIDFVIPFIILTLIFFFCLPRQKELHYAPL
jgi:hypothetical protein